jgi:sugar lactone lactonase YvrE
MAVRSKLFFPVVRLKTPYWIPVVLIILISGCATEQKCSTKPTFFPPPPDEPRIQYLTGITSSKDVCAKESQSTFSFIVTGKEAPSVIHKIGKAYGIAAHDNKLYVAESSTGRVTIVDPVNKGFEYLKGLANPKGVLQVPVNLAFDQEGYMYVADTGRREIVVYDKSGEYVKAFGRDIDKGSKIVSVATYKDKLYALDLGTSRIRVLDRKTGEQQAIFGYIEKVNQSLRAPDNFVIDANGGIYVANIGDNKVKKYDIDGNYIMSIGGIGDQFGQFVRPRGVAVDDAGRIFVVDAGFNTVQIFDDQARLLTIFGWPGLETGSLNLPAGIAVTKENLQFYQQYAVPGFKLEELIFVINQSGQDLCIPRISVYGLGQMEGQKKEMEGQKKERKEASQQDTTK